jgi:hypothetical protein
LIIYANVRVTHRHPNITMSRQFAGLRECSAASEEPRKQLGLSAQNYASVYKALPYGYGRTALHVTKPVSFMKEGLFIRYMEEQAAYRQANSSTRPPVITFQPPAGQPAQGEIQSDGKFALSTYKLNDGAVVGKHKIHIACYESQRPGTVKAPGEQSLGKLLIPEKYTLFDQSGFTAEVSADRNEPYVFEMVSPRG